MKLGDLLTLYGANGVGKSTLLRTLAGFVEPYSGQITYKDISLGFCLSVGYLGHTDGLKSSLTPLEHLTFELSVSSSTKISENEIRQALHSSGLPLKVLNQPIGLLSSGQRRRVALCLLSLKEAQLWLLDEPYVGLDKEGALILNEILKAHREKGGMVIIAQHQPPTEGLHFYMKERHHDSISA